MFKLNVEEPLFLKCSLPFCSQRGRLHPSCSGQKSGGEHFTRALSQRQCRCDISMQQHAHHWLGWNYKRFMFFGRKNMSPRLKSTKRNGFFCLFLATSLEQCGIFNGSSKFRVIFCISFDVVTHFLPFPRAALNYFIRALLHKTIFSLFIFCLLFFCYHNNAQGNFVLCKCFPMKMHIHLWDI